jgi:hypothetical protein
MAYSFIIDSESGDMERTFYFPVDSVSGHFRCLYVDPLNWSDTADVILLSFDEMDVWGTA